MHAHVDAVVRGQQALVHGIVQALEFPIVGVAGDGELVQAFQRVKSLEEALLLMVASSRLITVPLFV